MRKALAFQQLWGSYKVGFLLRDQGMLVGGLVCGPLGVISGNSFPTSALACSRTGYGHSLCGALGTRAVCSSLDGHSVLGEGGPKGELLKRTRSCSQSSPMPVAFMQVPWISLQDGGAMPVLRYREGHEDKGRTVRV